MSRPDQDAAMLSQAVALHQEGALPQARRLYEDVLRRHPRHPHALNLLGVLLAAQGEAERGLKLLRRAVALAPEAAGVRNNLGYELQRAGQPEEALRQLDAALALRPDYPAALNNRALALLDLRRPEEALAALDHALALEPEFGEAALNRAAALRELKRPAEALAVLDALLARLPDSAEAWQTRGGALLDLHRLEDAVAALDRALALRPEAVEALFSHALALLLLHRPAAALEDLDRLLALRPDHARALAQRAQALRTLGRHAEAAMAYQRLLSRHSAPPYARGGLLEMRRALCDWTREPAERAAVERAVAAGEPAMDPLSFLLVCDDPALQRRCAETWVARECALPPLPPRPALRPAGGRIRLAYCCGDFRTHPTAQLMADIIAGHDRQRFEVFALSFGPTRPDPWRERLHGAFDHWLEAAGLPDAEAAGLLAAQGIDVAVDLMGHVYGARPGILAQRPAPLQLGYLAHPGTHALPHLDAVLVDAVTVPPGAEADWAEPVLRLPLTYWAFSRSQPRPADVPSRTALGLPEAGFVFCCFNSHRKLAPERFALWCGLLRELPGSVLWLLEGGPAATANLRREAAARGVAPERLVFAPKLPLAQHLARQAAADLFLDTAPYGAHTGGTDALWAGLPVLTCAGRGFASRVAASQLRAAGLPELVAEGEAEYRAAALRLARDPRALAALRARLAAAHDSAPLFDTARQARDLEAAYAAMLDRLRRGEPAAG